MRNHLIHISDWGTQICPHDVSVSCIHDPFFPLTLHQPPPPNARTQTHANTSSLIFIFWAHTLLHEYLVLWLFCVIARCFDIYQEKNWVHTPQTSQPPLLSPSLSRWGIASAAPACPSPRVVDVETWWVPIPRQEYSLLVPKQIWCGLHVRQTFPSKSPLMLREILKLFYGPLFWDEQEWTNTPLCVLLSSCTWQVSGYASYMKWFRRKS